MIGAIAGDMLGARFERSPTKKYDFYLIPSIATFTDDTVLTIAIASAILTGTSYRDSLIEFAHRYPRCTYGRGFKKWMGSWDYKPYNSCGNGSAMRVSPVGFSFQSVEEVLHHAKASAEVTHNHPEGIKGAQAVALSVFLARKGGTKEIIRKEISQKFDYDLDRTVHQIRPLYKPDASCQGSVPESIIAFLDSKDYADSVRKAISLGGDADTMACIAGGISQAYYKHIPAEIVAHAKDGLPEDLLEVLETFNTRYGCVY